MFWAKNWEKSKDLSLIMVAENIIVHTLIIEKHIYIVVIAMWLTDSPGGPSGPVGPGGPAIPFIWGQAYLVSELHFLCEEVYEMRELYVPHLL